MTKATEEMLALADKIEYAIKTEGEITLFETNGTRVVYVLRSLAAQSAGAMTNLQKMQIALADEIEARTPSDTMQDLLLDRAERGLIVSALHLAAQSADAKPKGEDDAMTKANEDWKNDPSADERWNAGCDFALDQLCKFLDVDPAEIIWDGATETVEGDVQWVIGKVLCAKFGEDWDPHAQPPTVQQPFGAWLAQEIEYAQNGLEDCKTEGFGEQYACGYLDALMLVRNTALSVPPGDQARDDGDTAIEKVILIAQDVVWFDWSNNDSDAVHTMEQLRLALAALSSEVKKP